MRGRWSALRASNGSRLESTSPFQAHSTRLRSPTTSQRLPRLRASTQQGRRAIIEAFRQEHGSKPLADLTRGHIYAILGAKAHVPGAATNLLKTLRTMLAYAVDIGLLTRRSQQPLPLRPIQPRSTTRSTWASGRRPSAQ
jgi:hypothetical protein